MQPARILDLTPTEYHKLPGFSSSLAKILVQTCSLKAKVHHDMRLEKLAAEDESDDEDDKQSDQKQAQLDRGSVLHALVLGKGEERIDVIPAALLSGKNMAYQSDKAKSARDDARRRGKIPVKEPKMQSHLATADAIKSTLEAAGHLMGGRSELAIEWHERTPHGPVLCRGMMDHVVEFGPDPKAPTCAIIYDLKIVADANPDRCERTADNLGYAIQAAAYQRALNALRPSLAGRIRFQFLFIEPRRPFLLWDPERLSGPFREIGERQWLRAVHAWGEGLATGRWPDYRTPDRAEMSAPMWKLKAEGFTMEEL
jgi:hypothetical protein